jgi:hypothetical protein
MLGRLRKSLLEANYATLVLEIFVVILGILIAFQIDRWTEERQDRDQEYGYLLRLADDLKFEIGNMDAGLRQSDRRIKYARYLETVVLNPELGADDPAQLLTALEKVSWYSFPQLNGFVYNELQITGGLALIQSEELRRLLSDYYAGIRASERIAYERDSQLQYRRAVAGLLSTDELMFVEDQSWPDGVEGTSPQSALEIAREFSRRQEALDELPSIAHYNIFVRKAIENGRASAEEAVALIDELVRDFDR